MKINKKYITKKNIYVLILIVCMLPFVGTLKNGWTEYGSAILYGIDTETGFTFGFSDRFMMSILPVITLLIFGLTFAVPIIVVIEVGRWVWVRVRK